MTKLRIALAATAALAVAAPAAAQSDAPSGTRWRIGGGAQVVPQYPGAKDHQVTPLIGVSRAKDGREFKFSSADQSTGFSLVESDHFAFGPVVSFVGNRSRKDTGGLLPKVKFTPEAGGFAQFEYSNFRLRGEVRKGLGGHDGIIGVASADFVARDGDNWLFAIGPRATFTNGKYQRAYFGVPVGTPGLAAYRPGGGLQAVGATASALYSLGGAWGLSGYAKYDRLVNDASDSPAVRVLGDRNQWSGGLALTYTFGG
jgi:outer membrane protein